MRWQSVHTLSLEHDFTVIRCIQSRDHVEQRRFARTIRSNEARDSAREDLEGTSVDGAKTSEGFGYVSDLEDWRGACLGHAFTRGRYFFSGKTPSGRKSHGS